MKSFIIYDLAGQIKRTGTCGADDFLIQAQPGEFIIEGVADATKMIVNSQVVDKPIESYNLESGKIDKAREISNACKAQILSGFKSAALGALHHYPSNDRDQVNLSGTIQRSQLPSSNPSEFYPFLCADEADVWDYRLHTPTQIQTVGADAYDFILAARIKNASLQAQILQANSQSQIEAVAW